METMQRHTNELTLYPHVDVELESSHNSQQCFKEPARIFQITQQYVKSATDTGSNMFPKMGKVFHEKGVQVIKQNLGPGTHSSQVFIDKWLIHLAEGSWLFSLTLVIQNSFLQC